MQIVIDVDEAVAKDVLAAVKAETHTVLTNLDEIVADWLNQAAKRAAIHAAENEAAGKATTEYDAKKGGTIRVAKGVT